MYLSRLLLNNYRNYIREEFTPHSHLNLIQGENAQGKSNLLEAIFLLGMGKSPFNARSREIIRWGEGWFRLEGQVERRDHSLKVELVYKKDGVREMTINGQREENISQLLGRINVVLFSPEDLQLLKGGPALRRRYLDLQLCQISPRYFYYLQQYRRIIQQRNMLLKDIRFDHLREGEDLSVWDRQLIQVGTGIIYKRQGAVSKLAPLAAELHKKMSGGREELTVAYRPSISGRGERSPEEIAADFQRALAAVRGDELKRQFTMIGPHRDDISLYINGRDGRKYGSQGQQRTAALSLKLAETLYIEEEMGEHPILLLDDIMSELDSRRRQFVFDGVQGKGQVFITGTEGDEFSPGTRGRRYHISQGRILEGWSPD